MKQNFLFLFLFLYCNFWVTRHTLSLSAISLLSSFSLSLSSGFHSLSLHSTSLRSSMAINKDSTPPTMIGKIRPYIVFMKPPSTSSQLPKAFSTTIFRFIQEDRCPSTSRMRFLINGPGEEWEGLTKNNLGLITYKVVPFCILVPLPFLSFESSNFWKHLKKKEIYFLVLINHNGKQNDDFCFFFN